MSCVSPVLRLTTTIKLQPGGLVSGGEQTNAKSHSLPSEVTLPLPPKVSRTYLFRSKPCFWAVVRASLSAAPRDSLCASAGGLTGSAGGHAPADETASK